MKLQREFPAQHPTGTSLRGAFRRFRVLQGHDAAPDHLEIRLRRGRNTWEFDEPADFFDVLDTKVDEAHFTMLGGDDVFEVHLRAGGSMCRIGLHTQEAIIDVVDRLALGMTSVGEIPRSVFVAHGRDPAWKEVVALLEDLPGVVPVAFEDIVKPGQYAAQVLEEIARSASFAVLIHTTQSSEGGTARPSPNVIHETGYFQARLGLSRCLVLRDADCEPYANVLGLAELVFPSGRISACLDDARALMMRALPLTSA